MNRRRAAENERKGREDPRGGFVGGVQVVVRGAERRRAACLAGASCPQSVGWGAVVNAVLDGSPRRCNGVVLARLRAAATRAKSHVIHCSTGFLGGDLSRLLCSVFGPGRVCRCSISS